MSVCFLVSVTYWVPPKRSRHGESKILLLQFLCLLCFWISFHVPHPSKVHGNERSRYFWCGPHCPSAVFSLKSYLTKLELTLHLHMSRVVACEHRRVCWTLSFVVFGRECVAHYQSAITPILFEMKPPTSSFDENSKNFQPYLPRVIYDTRKIRQNSLCLLNKGLGTINFSWGLLCTLKFSCGVICKKCHENFPNYKKNFQSTRGILKILMALTLFLI